jgi:hypothetical protein
MKCGFYGVFFDSHANGYQILIAEPVHFQDFCGNWSHRWTALEAGSMLIRDTLKVRRDPLPKPFATRLSNAKFWARPPWAGLVRAGFRLLESE